MAEAPPFKPVKEFGSLTLSDDSELKFYVDEYKGYTYASIRTFLKRSGYAGPTKAGITMNAGLLQNVIDTLSKLPGEPQEIEDRELARFPKKMGIQFVIRITLYKDTTGADLREWVDDGTYQGWSKKGVRIPYPAIPRALEFLRGMSQFLKR